MFNSPSRGGPRGGKIGCCIVGVTAFGMLVELLPERRSEDELDSELRDLFKWGPVWARLTTRLEGRTVAADCVAVALVKVNVKYCVSSILHMVMIQVAWKALFCGCFLSFFATTPSGPCESGDIMTSTETSNTVLRARFVVLKGGNGGLDGEEVRPFVECAVGVVFPLCN